MSEDTHLREKHSTLRYSIEQFDKSVLFIASGALGISFAFIKDIIPNIKEAVGKCLLTSSWYIFAGVIFISLICHFISMLAHSWGIKNDGLEPEEYNKAIDKWNFWIRGINVIMVLSLFVGTILLIMFINKNL